MKVPSKLKLEIQELYYEDGYATVTDIDGNAYNTVTIGNQVWMAENLKTTTYNDGTPIPLVIDGATWGALTTPAYCWYNNDEATNKELYGALYNWYTVNTGKRIETLTKKKLTLNILLCLAVLVIAIIFFAIHFS